MFYAALKVTQQPVPDRRHPFYVFPQVSLGQIIKANAPWDWQAEMAHRAINSKRCDLLIADRRGNPVAVLEYQGAAHNLGGTAEVRDTIKRIALEGAGIRFVEIDDGTSAAAMRQIIQRTLDAR
jgi:Protein of unknown function (DUF2726)